MPFFSSRIPFSLFNIGYCKRNFINIFYFMQHFHALRIQGNAGRISQYDRFNVKADFFGGPTPPQHVTGKNK